ANRTGTTVLLLAHAPPRRTAAVHHGAACGEEGRAPGTIRRSGFDGAGPIVVADTPSLGRSSVRVSAFRLTCPELPTAAAAQIVALPSRCVQPILPRRPGSALGARVVGWAAHTRPPLKHAGAAYASASANRAPARSPRAGPSWPLTLRLL